MKFIKFDKFDKPVLQSQHEIKVTPNYIRTPKSTKSQTLIIFKSSSNNLKQNSVHKQSTHQLNQKCQQQQSCNTQYQNCSQQNPISIVKECISILSDIKSTSFLLFPNKKLTSKTKEKLEHISIIINQMIPQDHNEQKIQKKLNQEKILQMMKLLMQEKQQKYQAIKSGESLIKQQQEQILSLKTKISVYISNDDDNK